MRGNCRSRTSRFVLVLCLLGCAAPRERHEGEIPLETGGILFLGKGSFASAKLPDDAPTIVRLLDVPDLASLKLVDVRTEVKPHYHADHDEIVYLIEGEGRFLLGEDVFQGVVAGSLMYIPRGKVHAFRSTGSSPARALSVFVPEFDDKDRIFVMEAPKP